MQLKLKTLYICSFILIVYPLLVFYTHKFSFGFQASCVHLFEEFYGRYNGRQIRWMCSLGTCCVEVRFDRKVIELLMVPHQVVVLSLFSEVGSLRYEETEERLDVEEKVLVPLLHSLACGKYDILTKEPKNSVVSKTDAFQLNRKFDSSGLSRIKFDAIGSYAIIGDLVVYKHLRRIGIGSSLLSFDEKEASVSKIDQIFLYPNLSNKGATDFYKNYKKAGYQFLETYGAGFYDTWMKKI